MKKAFLSALALALLVILSFGEIPAQTGCKGMMQWSELGWPSPAYNACGSILKATIDFNVIYAIPPDAGGYHSMYCRVINSGWGREVNPHLYSPGHFQIIEYWNCTSRLNHQLQIDVTPDLEYGLKLDPNWLKAEYFEDNPQSPEP